MIDLKSKINQIVKQVDDWGKKMFLHCLKE